MRLKVLITGASKGLGLALTKELLQRGMMVWGVARSEFDTLKVISVGNESFIYSQCDIRKYDEVGRVISEMTEKNFIPDIIIFSAGSATDDVIDGIDYGRFRENYDVNLFGAISWIEGFLPFFIKRKSGIFAAVSSLSIYRENHKNRIGYSSSKLALSKAFENLRQQYYSSGIRFVVFCPGRMSEKRHGFIGGSYLDAARFIVDRLLLNRFSHQINFPRLQYILTKASRFIPDSLYSKYIFK